MQVIIQLLVNERQLHVFAPLFCSKMLFLPTENAKSVISCRDRNSKTITRIDVTKERDSKYCGWRLLFCDILSINGRCAAREDMSSNHDASKPVPQKNPECPRLFDVRLISSASNAPATSAFTLSGDISALKRRSARRLILFLFRRGNRDRPRSPSLL